MWYMMHMVYGIVHTLQIVSEIGIIVEKETRFADSWENVQVIYQ